MDSLVFEKATFQYLILSITLWSLSSAKKNLNISLSKNYQNFRRRQQLD